MSGIASLYVMLVLILTVVYAVNRYQGRVSKCTTPDKKPGVCVPLSTCSTIDALRKKKARFLPISVSKYITQYQCGKFINNHHLEQYICCDPKRVIGGKTTTAQTTASTPTITFNSVMGGRGANVSIQTTALTPVTPSKFFIRGRGETVPVQTTTSFPVTISKSVIGELRETAPIQTTTSSPSTTPKSVMVGRGETVPIQTKFSPLATTSKSVISERAETAPVRTTASYLVITSKSVMGGRGETVPIQTTALPPVTPSEFFIRGRGETAPVQNTTLHPVTISKSVIGERGETAPIQTESSTPVTISKSVIGKGEETAPLQTTASFPSTTPKSVKKFSPLVTTSKSVMGEGAATAPLQTTASPPVSTSTPVKLKGIVKSEAYIRVGMDLLDEVKCGACDTHRIANGENANLSEYPWMALLIYSNSNGIGRSLNCDGSLIHKRYVLTVAHCIQVFGQILISVRLGEHNTETIEDCEGVGVKRECAKPTQEIDIAEAIIHKYYNASSQSNDIGLLRLVSDAIIETNVSPICLPITKKSRDRVLDNVTIAGWGLTQNNTKANILQKAPVSIKTNDYCQQINKLVTFTQNHLCAVGENESATCRGDSGGPLFDIAAYKWGLNYIQYGVIMFGSIHCGSKNPQMYARVESYLPWIASNLKKD